MGYIKKLKNNELVGGTDKHTIYPVTSTKAVFEEVTEGDKSSFKSQETINSEHDDRIKGLESEMPDTIKSITINGGTKTYLPEDGNVKLTIYSEGGEDYPAISELVEQNAANIENIQNEIGTDTTEDTLSGRIKSLETNVGTGGTVDSRIATTKAELEEQIAGKQKTLSVGAGITLTSDGVISSTADPSIGKVVETRPTTDIIEGMIYLVPTTTAGTYYQYVYHDGQWNDGTPTVSLGITTDDTLDSTSSNPIQNAAIAAQIGYFVCGNGYASSETKDVDALGFNLPDVGGDFKIKMNAANTHAGPVYLRFNSSNDTKAELKYNRESVSPTNTWEEGEVISVYYDGTYYQATNVQGSGGKAEKIKYDNSQSQLTAENVQEALDEVCENLGDTSLKTGIGYTLVDNTAYEITNGKVTIKTNASQYRRLEPIDVTDFTKVGARFYLLGSYSYVTAFTDSEDNVIGDKLVNTTEDYVEYNVPEGATKLYVCGRKQTSGNVDTTNLSVYGKVAQSVEEALEKLKEDAGSALSSNISYRRVVVASENTYNGYFMNNATNGSVWMYSTSYTRTHCMVPRTPGMKTVTMTRNNDVAAKMAFLKTYTAVTSNLQLMDLCDGFQLSDGTIASTSEHTTRTFAIPDDCNYIVFDIVYQDANSRRDETPANILIGETDMGTGLWAYEDVDIHTLTQYEGLPSTNSSYNDGLPAYLKSTSSAVRRHIALPVAEGEKYIVETIGLVNIAFSASNKTNPSNWEDLGAVDSTLYKENGTRLFEVPTGANYMIIGSSVTTLGDMSAKIKSIKKYAKDSLLDMALANDTTEYYVGASRAGHSLIGLFETLKNDANKKTIYIDAGTYDIFQDYLDNEITPPADGQTSTSDYFDYNSFLPPNTKLVGLGKVILSMKPTKQQLLDYADSLSDTTDVNARASIISKIWSPLNIGGSCEIDNITIETKNVRYCIHDDMHSADIDSEHIYHNVKCVTEIPEEINSAILGFAITVGMGWSSGSKHEYNDCVFENKNSKRSFYGHGSPGKGSTLTFNHCAFIGDSNHTDSVNFQTLSGDVYSKVLMADCYIMGSIRLQLYGGSHNSFDITSINCNHVVGTNPKYNIDDTSNPYPVTEISEKLWNYESINIYSLPQYEGFPTRNQSYNDGKPIYIPSSGSNVRRHIAIEVTEGEKYAIDANGGVNIAFASTNKTNPSSYEDLGAVDNAIYIFNGCSFLTVPAGAHYMIVGSSLSTLGDRIKSIKNIRKYRENSLLDLVSKNSTFDILVAASDSDVRDKRKADVVCDGTNDAAVITTLMQTYSRKHNIVLASGTFYIHSFSGGGDGTVGIPYVAIPLTESTAVGFTAKIKGVYPSGYGTSWLTSDTPNIRGTRFVVTEDCYNSLDDDKYYAVFGGIDGTYNTWKLYQLVLEDVGIYLPDNKKNIICVDGINIGGMDLYHCVFRGNVFYNRHPTEQQPLQIGVDGCIGVRGHRGACNGLAIKWECCAAYSMGVGFSVCGEHLVLIHPDAIGNKYGFWFNQFPALRNDSNSSDSEDAINGKSWLYPNVLIQPMDEVCANYMRFGKNPQKQGLDIIGLNVEHHNEIFSSDGNGHLATEDIPGSWAGNITYVIGHNLNNDNPGSSNKYRNMWEYPLFANDGSGKNFNSKNEAHALTGTTATRLTYAANWWQRYWDTDFGKEVICIDPTTSPQTWALADGTIV